MSIAGVQLQPSQWRQVTWISAGALAVFLALRWLPTGTNLSHMDFRVDARGTNAIEFCDPLNPQFISVVAMRSPVAMVVRAAVPAKSGAEVSAVATLRTASGKEISPADLLEVHTRKLHLLIVDPTLTDYQHVHPEPGAKAGEWTFAFTPRKSGAYRVFADFTPAATQRGLYASADLEVGQFSGLTGSKLTVEAAAPGQAGQVRDLTYSLLPTPAVIRAGQPVDLKFSIARRDGGAVPLEPVMGAYAHLVAFDEKRTGFAHLHPAEADLTKRPDATRPELNFKLTIPQAGRYAIWAQVNLGGREEFVPFWFEVGK